VPAFDRNVEAVAAMKLRRSHISSGSVICPLLEICDEAISTTFVATN